MTGDAGVSLRDHSQGEQGVVELVGIADQGPGIAGGAVYGLWVEASQVAAGLRQRAAQGDRPGAALFQRGVVQEGVGHGVEDLVAEHRWLGRVTGQHLDVAPLYRRYDVPETLEVHRLCEAVPQGLEDQRMLRDLDVACRGVVLALDLRWEDRGQQVFGPHPKQRGRNLPSRGEPQQGKAPRGVPPPSYAEQRRLEHRLLKHLLGVARLHVAEHVGQREREGGTQRQADAVVGGSGLELEVEGTADLLAQRHAPGPIDGRPEGRVDHQLHAARLVEEPLGYDAALGGRRSQYAHPLGDVGRRLLGGIPRDAGGVREPALSVAGVDAAVELFPEIGDLVGQLGSAARRLADPEGDRWRRSLGVLDPDPAALDAANPPRGVAQEEDVAPHTLDGEIFVDGAHEGVLRLGDDVVVGVVGDSAAAGEGRQTGAAAPAQLAVYRVAVDVSTPASVAGRDPLGEHLDDLVVALSGKLAVGVRPADQVEQPVLLPLPGRALGHYLLGQNVQGPGLYPQPVEIAPPHTPHQRGALYELIPGEGEEAALRGAAKVVSGPADPLEEQPQGARRAHLAHQVYRADVHAQLQGGRRYAHLDVAALQPLLGLVASLLGEAAVVGDDRLLA